MGGYMGEYYINITIHACEDVFFCLFVMLRKYTQNSSPHFRRTFAA